MKNEETEMNFTFATSANGGTWTDRYPVLSLADAVAAIRNCRGDERGIARSPLMVIESDADGIRRSA